MRKIGNEETADIKKEISVRLGDLQDAAGYSDRDLASKLGVSARTVRWWRDGECITLDCLLMLCALYGVTISDLLEGL